MRTSTKIKAAFILVNAVAALYAARNGRPAGRFLCLPYDFTAPTLGRVKERVWNEDEERVLTPPVFGAGWSLNLRAVARRLGLLQPGGGSAGVERASASEPGEDLS